MLVLASNVQVDTWSYSYCLDSRAGSGGPRAPRHAIWPGPLILATYNSSKSVKPLHQVIGGFTKTQHWLLFPQRIQYMIALVRVLGGADLAWRPPIYASFTAISLLVQQAAVKFPLFCSRRFDGLVC